MRFAIKTELTYQLLHKTLSPLRESFSGLQCFMQNGLELTIERAGLRGTCFDLPLFYGKIPLGRVTVWCKDRLLAQEIVLLMGPVLYPLLLDEKNSVRLLRYFDHSLDWIDSAKAIAPELCNWIGLYFQAAHLNSSAPTDSLWVAPYRGEATEHMDIPVQSGLCGLAFREKRIVNMADVHADSRHIACSLKTKSELILPLFNSSGEMIAELDIDSWTAGAFTPAIEEAFVNYAKSFRSFDE